MKKNYYEILGVDKTAEAPAIKKAYRKLAKKYHPDTNGGDKNAEQKFKEVSTAYQVLGDPEKRKLYDEFGEIAFTEGFSAERARAAKNFNGSYGSNFGGTGSGYTEFHFEGGDMDDIFGDFFGKSFQGKQSRGFKGFTGGRSDSYDGFSGRRSRSYSMKGSDMNASITVGFDDAVYGSDRIITLQNPDTGEAPQSLQVHIPAGIDDGKTIRLKGKGNPGIGGGEPGDLLLKVNVETKPGYERKGMDVYTTVRIPYTTAVLGGEIRVHTLYGDVECRIREGTQSGSKIRLKGKGIVSMKNSSVHGDHYVVIQIDVPKHLKKEAKEKLREFQQACA